MDLHAADVKFLCSDRCTRRKTLCEDMMMIHYDPEVQAGIISQRMNRPAHIAAGSGRREKNNSEICTCTG